MRRFRWSLAFLIGVVVIGAGASSVLAGSHATKATYWNNVIAPSQVPGPDPVHYLDTATWKFTGLAPLYGAVEVDLNFHANVQSMWDGGGSGYPVTLSVNVTGNGTSTFTVTLANPWRPHVAFSNDAQGYGHDAFGSLKLPTSLWRYTNSLTVKVRSQSSNTITSFDGNALLIGYVTASF